MKELEGFLVEAGINGYSNGQEGTKEEDGSTTIRYENGEWSMYDNFFGGEPYGGREIIFKEKKPFWMMVYYGRVNEGNDPNDVYPVLRAALSKPDTTMPIRGPKRYTQGEYQYSFSWSGDIEGFSASESISRGTNEIYSATFLGGAVDRRDGQ